MKSAEEARHDSRTRGAIALGAMALIALLVPGVGIPFAIAGLILGVMSLNSLDRHRARVGIVMSLIGLLLAVVILVTLAWAITSDTISRDAVGTMILGRSLVVLVGMFGVLILIGPLRMWYRKIARRNADWYAVLALSCAYLSVFRISDLDLVLAYAASAVLMAVSSVVGYRARRDAVGTGGGEECG